MHGGRWRFWRLFFQRHCRRRDDADQRLSIGTLQVGRPQRRCGRTQRGVDAERAARARELFEARQKRLNRQTTRRRRTNRHDATVDAREDAAAGAEAKKSTIADAIARAKAKREQRD